ncbi:MAG TPA: hypothetical protein PK622_02520 [Saprospiraceae bacterium]|jgi:hypothetical protein|nr:hypothetical protein [Saprospiraceae bacterium]
MPKIIFVYFLLFVWNSPDITAQSMWQVMGQVSYQKIKDESLGFELDYPLFSKELQSYEGKQITIRGYIIPTDGYKSQKEFVFSAFPYKSCFFCGGAGPETVIEVFSTNGINFTSEKIEIKGILKLNRTDLNRLMFQLLNAEEIK